MSIEWKTDVHVSDVAIAVSVVAVCVTVCIIGLLIYCHKNRKRFDYFATIFLLVSIDSL